MGQNSLYVITEPPVLLLWFRSKKTEIMARFLGLQAKLFIKSIINTIINTIIALSNFMKSYTCALRNLERIFVSIQQNNCVLLLLFERTITSLFKHF